MKKLSTILLPIELTDQDRDDLKTVAAFAKEKGANLEVLHVVESNIAPYQDAVPSTDMEGTALNYLNKFILDNVGDDPNIKAKVLSGKVNQELLIYIEESQPDLVIMPTKKEEEGKNHLGGTAYRILSSCGVPVLTMTSAPVNLRPKKVLIPIDVYFGIYDLKKVLFDFFREDSPEIEIMIVVDPQDSLDEQSREKRILKYELGKFAELGFKEIQGKIIEHNEPSEAIVYHAEKGNFDMIIMSTHGRKGLSQFFMGSTTAEVIHSSKIPVFTVKGEKHGKGISYYAVNMPI